MAISIGIRTQSDGKDAAKMIYCLHLSLMDSVVTQQNMTHRQPTSCARINYEKNVKTIKIISTAGRST